MLKAFRIQFGVAILAMLAGALFLVPSRAAADSFTVDATITWNNESSRFNPPSIGTTGTITGSYEFTDDEGTISIGAWSFDLSSLGISSISSTSTDPGVGVDILQGLPCGGSRLCDYFSFTNGKNENDGTRLTIEVLDDPSHIHPSTGTDCACSVIFNHIAFQVPFTSIVLTKVATPEPSSLPLLGLGLAPLAWCRFRRGSFGRLASAA